MPTFLHIGSGKKRKKHTTPGFDRPEWTELRLDIDPQAAPDIVASMTDMSAVASDSADAIFSGHNIEHLYAYQVPAALAEFRRVLKPAGFVVITCPDLQMVAAIVAEGRLNEPLYQSTKGPISAADILFGHGASLAAGNHYMAHNYGFTLKSLAEALTGAGFGAVRGMRRRPALDLWMVATKAKASDAEIQALADAHFPSLTPPDAAPSPPG
jgi:hypothetical protein